MSQLSQLDLCFSGSHALSPKTYCIQANPATPAEGMDEKVLRLQKRMVKNRESAARSRQRKQAYTQELEQQVSWIIWIPCTSMNGGLHLY